MPRHHGWRLGSSLRRQCGEGAGLAHALFLGGDPDSREIAVWETALISLIAKLDAGHLVFLTVIAGREYVAYKERQLLSTALEKLVDSMNGVKIVLAAVTGRAL